MIENPNQFELFWSLEFWSLELICYLVLGISLLVSGYWQLVTTFLEILPLKLSRAVPPIVRGLYGHLPPNHGSS